MICGGHEGKNHLRSLESYAKLKIASAKLIKIHKIKFPSMECECPRNHKSGCARGCLSDAFVKHARNNFSFILKDSKTPNEFSRRIKSLPRHARDEHLCGHGSNKQCCEFLYSYVAVVNVIKVTH